VRLGFEADKDVTIHRSEVWERIQAVGETDSPTGDPMVPVG